MNKLRTGLSKLLLQYAGGTPVFQQMLQTSYVRKALFVGCCLQMFQQITGINTVM